jgi:hypothetical protein
VVEMMLGFYTMNNRFIRNTIKILFKKILPLLTPESIKLLIDLLDPNSENNLMADEGDDDYDDADEGNDEVIDSIENDTDMESSASSTPSRHQLSNRRKSLQLECFLLLR